MATTSSSSGVRGSILDLSPKLRVAFALAYVVVMTAVAATAEVRPDHVFGFQMFNESSTVTLHLFRQVRGRRRLEPLRDGVLVERTPRGTTVVRWGDRVRDPVLGVLDRPVHAKYGVAGQLFRLQFALEQFLARVPRDGDTTAVVAVVDAALNGRPPRPVRLEAVRR